MEYLNYEVTQLPDSIENLFCKPLDENGKREKMSEMQTQIVYLSLTLPDSDIDSLYSEIKKNDIGLSILEDRLQLLNCEHDKRSMIVIALFCETPGEAVMYAHYLAYKSKELKLDSINSTNLCDSIIPFGPFTKDTLYEYWNKQKVICEEVVYRGSDNLLDYSSAAISITK